MVEGIWYKADECLNEKDRKGFLNTIRSMSMIELQGGVEARTFRD